VGGRGTEGEESGGQGGGCGRQTLSGESNAFCFVKARRIWAILGSGLCAACTGFDRPSRGDEQGEWPLSSGVVGEVHLILKC